MFSNRYFLNSMRRVLVASCLVVSLFSGVHASPSDAFGAKTNVEDPYKVRLMDQLTKLDLKPDQVEAFQERVNEYFAERNGAQRRIGRQGGAVDVRVRRDLRRVENRAVEAMASILTTEQLEKYRRFVQVGNKQYMANSGLL
jgi:hypothetical protein